MMPRRGDAHRLLLRALRTGWPALEIVESSSEPWASVTFSGKRHRMTCRTTEVPADLDTQLGDAEFRLPGHIVADIGIETNVADDAGWTIVIGALTVEDV
jgi:hypothetical protein